MNLQKFEKLAKLENNIEYIFFPKLLELVRKKIYNLMKTNNKNRRVYYLIFYFLNIFNELI